MIIILGPAKNNIKSHNEEYIVNEFHKNFYLIILGGQVREDQDENQQNSSSTMLTRQ